MIFADESRQPAPEVTPEQGRLLTSFWSAAERSMWMSRPGKVHANAPLRDCHITDTFPLPSPSHKGIVRA